jgi:putative hydrolase of the HAD superfamily
MKPGRARMVTPPVATLFLDVGGVLLTNGWDRVQRHEAAERFGLDEEEMNERHHLTFDTYEEGKLSLEAYLDRVVFYRERPFSREDFKTFMLSRSRPYPPMIELVGALKERYRLKVAVVSNEGRELAIHRIREFQLVRIVDFFIFSCFVHARKPDAEIYRISLDIAQTPPEQVVYIEDRPLLVEVACSLGIRGIRHSSYEATRTALAGLGLSPAV